MKPLYTLLIPLFGGAFLLSGNATEPPRPNIVLIMADDNGFSDLGSYGGEIQTPNLDRLAAGGIRFRQFYNSTRCCPARASLNTGLYPHQAGIGAMDHRTDRRGYEGYLTDRCITTAEVLKSAGYRTYVVGKWHMNINPGPLERGFDEFFGLLQGHSSDNFDPGAHRRLPEGRPLREYPAGRYYATDVFTDYALDFLADSRKPDASGERPPFFLYIAHTAPHFPLQAYPEDVAKYVDTYHKGWDVLREERFARLKELGMIDERYTLPSREFVPRNRYNDQTGWADRYNPAWDSLDANRRADLARRMAIFAAMTDRMDQNIGRIIADLEEHGDLDNTLILFLSDNGACAEWDPWGFDISSGPRNVMHQGDELDAMGGPGTYHSYGSGWANASNTPFRLYKHYIHEGGVRTPMIAHWPKGIGRQGAIEDSVGHLIDFMPTFIEISGAVYPAERNGMPIIPMEGRSLVKAFTGTQTEPRTLYWEHEGNRGIREGDLKLVWMDVRGIWELYDLKTDPVELHDLAEERPETVQRLATAWTNWARRTFVIDEPDTMPGLKFDLDLSQHELRDLSGKDNLLAIIGELPVEQRGRQFNRQAYIEVPHSDSLHCAGTAWTVEAAIVPNVPAGNDGVILARGGVSNGYSLALRAGRPVFTVTVNGNRYVIQGEECLSGRTVLTGTIDDERRMSLAIDGVSVGELALPAFLDLPQEGMQIGIDRGTSVNDPPLPGFVGIIERVRIYRGMPADG